MTTASFLHALNQTEVMQSQMKDTSSRKRLLLTPFRSVVLRSSLHCLGFPCILQPNHTQWLLTLPAPCFTLLSSCSFILSPPVSKEQDASPQTGF